MAECKVIIECCTGQTGCNEKVSIGYLKSFIKNTLGEDLILTTGGTPVSVTTTQSDAYEPTYAELTGGTLLPIFYDAGTNRGASNIDGITINGTYNNNETVDQTDLILTYTRFKGLTISAGKTTFSQCGDNTSLSYNYTLTKSVKGISVCDPLTYSTTQTEIKDTSNTSPNNVTFSSNRSWLTVNGTTATAGKNGYMQAASRSGTITASLVYKGSTKSASNSITITQNALTGSYSTYDDRYYTGVEITSHSETAQTSCAELTVNASATGYYYDRYYWTDNCNYTYWSEGEYQDYDGSEGAGSSSYTFSVVHCPTESQVDRHTINFPYHGYSDSIEFVRTCSQTCNCPSWKDYGSCTYNNQSDESLWAAVCGGDFQVCCSIPITTHTGTWVEGVCTDVTGTTSDEQCATIVIPENTLQTATSHTGSVTTEEGGVINYTVWQKAGPCGGCTGDVTTNSWENKSVNVGACDESVTVTLNGTATTRYDNCSATTASVTTSLTYTFATNETSDPITITKTFEGATITINQAAGPCHGCTGETTSYTWNNTTGTAGMCDTAATVTIYGVRTLSYGNCPDVTASTSTTQTYTFSKNNTSNAVTHTFYYPDSSSAGHATITITQDAGPCACTGETTSITWTDTATTAGACDTSVLVNISGSKIYHYGNCPDSSVTTSTTATYTFSKNNTSNAVTHTFYYPDSTTQGHATITVTQAAGPCECLDETTTYEYGDVSEHVNPCQTSSSLDIPYTATTTYSNCPSRQVIGTVPVTVTYEVCNEGSSPYITRTFYYPSDKPAGYGTITLVQACPCDCLNPSTTYCYGRVETTAGKCDTSKTVNVPYSAITSYSNCPDSVSTGTSAVTVTFTKNQTTTEQTHSLTLPCGGGVTVVQAAGPCDCTPSTSYTYANVTSGAGKCDTSKTVSIPYTATTLNADCTTSTSYGSASTTVTFTKNNTSSATAHTFYYPDSTTPGHSTITINQAAGPCECTPATSYTYANVTSGAGKCDTSKIVNIPYTATTTGSDCTITSEIIGTATTTVSFTANETAVATAHTFYYPDSTTPGHSTITINQEAGPCTITCTCTNAISVSPSSLEFAYNDYEGASRAKSFTATVASCGEITAARFTSTTGDSYFNTASAATTNGIEFKFNPDTANTTPSDITGTFRIQYKANGTTCTAKDVPIIQHHSTDPCLNAVCSAVTVTGITTTFTKSAHTNESVGSYTAHACASNYSATSSQRWLSVSADTSTNTVKGTMEAQGCETTARQSTVTLSWTVNGNSCSSSWTVTQAGDSTTCPCQTYEYSATTDIPQGGLTVDKCGGYTTANFTVKRRCTSTTPYGSWENFTGYSFEITKISQTNYFTLTTGASYVTFTKDTPNATSGALVDGYKIVFKVGTTQIGSDVYVNVTQPTGGTNCDCIGKQCNELTLSNIKTTNFNSYAHYGEKIADISKSSCVSNLSVSVTSGGTWLSAGLGSTSGAVYAYMDAQGCETSARSGTVQVSYVVDGHNCSSAITVGQNGDSTPCTNPCSCSNFSASTTALTFNNDGTMVGTIYWTKSPDCDGTFTLSGNGNVSACTLNSNGTISVRAYPNYSLWDTLSVEVKVLYDGSECTSWKMTGTVPEADCDCSNLIAPEYMLSGPIPSSGGSNIIIWRVDPVWCLYRIEAFDDDCDSLFTSIGTGSSYYASEGKTYDVVSATVSSNTSENDKTCKIGVKTYVDDSSSYCSYEYSAVTIAGTGACTCLAANADLGEIQPSSSIPDTGGTGYWVSYTADCGTMSATVDYNWAQITSIDTGNGRIYFSVDANTGSSNRSNFVNLYINGTLCTYKIFSQGYPTPCTCTNANINVSATTTVISGDGVQDALVAKYSADCENNLVFSSPDGLTDLHTSGGNVYADVPANTSPTSNKTYTIEWSMNGTKCTGSTTITQGMAGCDCTNSHFNVSPTALTVSSATSSSNYVSFSADCGTVTGTVTSGSSWITGVTAYTYSKKVYVGVTTNTGAQRSGIVRVYLDGYSGTCYQNVTITQNSGQTPCYCADMAITSAPYSSTCISSDSHTEEQIASFSGACGTITAITSNQTWISDLSWSNNASGSITADIAPNCGSAREATITVNYTVNGSSCTNRTFKVKQCAGGYTGLSLNGTPDCNGGMFTYTPTPRT